MKWNFLRNNSFKIVIAGLSLVFLQCRDDSEKPTVTDNVLPSNNVISIYIDDNNIKWFGTDSGLVFMSDDKFIVYDSDNGVAGDLISSLSHQTGNSGDELWVATNSGVSVHSYDVDGITAATVYHDDNSGLQNDTVNAINVDSDNVRWIGTNIGLSVFAGHDWISKLFTELRPRIRSKKINCIESGRDGWNYVGTKGDGVARYRYDAVDGITGASMIDTDWSDIPDDNVLSVFIDEWGNQYYGTANGAAVHEGTETRENWTVYSNEDGLPGDSVLTVFMDSKNRFWMGTPQGLSMKDGDAWHNYTTDEGLSGNRINAIDEDISGNIWVATNAGISVFDGSAWKIYKNEY